MTRPSPVGHELLRFVVLAGSIVGTCASAVLAVMSFVAAFPSVSSVAWFVLFPGALGAFVYTVRFVNRVRSADDAPELWSLAGLARRYWWLALAIPLVIVSVLTSLASLLHGQATVINGAYFLDDHGALIRISHSAYLRTLAAEQRLFAGVSCGFYSVAAAVTSHWWRADAANTSPG